MLEKRDKTYVIALFLKAIVAGVFSTYSSSKLVVW